MLVVSCSSPRAQSAGARPQASVPPLTSPKATRGAGSNDRVPMTGPTVSRLSGGTGSGAAAARKKTVSAKDVIEAHARYGAGVIHEENNEPELALKEYYEAALKDPEDETLVIEVSGKFLQAKQPEKALDLLTRAAACPDASGSLFVQLGFVYSKLGKMDLVAKASRTAIQKQPQLLDGYRNLFGFYLQNRQMQEALNTLDEAARVPDTEPDFLIGLAELYATLSLQAPALKESAHARALAVLQRAEKSEPADPQLRLRLADGFNLLGKDDQAAKIYLNLLERLADNLFARDNVRAKLADIYLRDQDHKRAIEQLEAIIRDNPTDAQAYYLLGSIAYEAKNYAQAAENFDKTILLDPAFEPAYYDLAGALMSEDKNSDALATLDKARLRFPQSFASEYLAGVAFSQGKDYAAAIQHFTAAEVVAQATDPKLLSDYFYFQFGAACERKGDYAQAETYFDKCLRLSPDFAEAQNYLGYMLAEHGEKLSHARDLIEKALKTEPKNSAYLDSMGWVLFKLNQPKQALDYILKAIQLSEEQNATEYDHLGDIYAALGQAEKAREAWRKSLSLEPNDSVRKKLEPAVAK
jgi:tetratricopeptide (TPR) repeat protein